MPIENTAGDVVEKKTPSMQPGTSLAKNVQWKSGYYPNPKPASTEVSNIFRRNSQVSGKMLKSGNQDKMEVCMCSFFGIAIFSNFNNLMRPLCKKGDRSEDPLIYNIFVIPNIYNLA